MVDLRTWHYVTSVDKLPKGKKLYAIATSGSIYVPGDERSRTNPGHGYPGGSEPVIELKVTEDEEAWKLEIAEMKTSSYYQKPFRAFIIQPVEIDVSVSVEVKPT